MRLSLFLIVLPLAMAVPARRERAPLLRPRTDDRNLLAGKYIVKFKDGKGGDKMSVSALNNKISTLNVSPDHVYKTTFQGFSGQLTDEELEALRHSNDRKVEYVEQDSSLSAYAYVEQASPPWGLGRISTRDRKTGIPYTYDSSAGAGTCAYVIDTGIDATHPDFEGRAEMVANFVDNINTDDDGHGTHVAATIGGAKYGVAKKTRLLGIRVLTKDGDGSLAGFIKGMDFVAEDSAKRNCTQGVVSNMSVGGAFSTSINEAAASMVKKNIFLAVAAGNSNTDAEDFSPASEPTVCTVGAASPWDGRWLHSNYGAAVDVYAPGQNILSALPGGTEGEKSGTSMASPHIAGLAAYLAGLEGFTDPQTLCKRIADMATEGKLGGIPEDTPNKLAFNGNPSGK
ncbi:unnamed protein product [Clonostachys rosea f. rosea IK726]|uniref:Uncharacterized protein n=1 Tax=Clonostachys rosea f. rosea IK726 TaxID=1349383 RepID=A0ACA9UIP7_BIOOC|nr:unnamed protein product [Clonostachys rosea f. rosea IK726]